MCRPSYSLSGAGAADPLGQQVGGVTLGGAVERAYSPVTVPESAVDKGAAILLVPVRARRQIDELSDEMAARLAIVFYQDVRDALIKAPGD